MLKKLTGLVSDALTYGASNMLAQILSFLLLPLYTRYLTPEDYGVLGLLTIIITLFAPLANLGMTNAIFRHFNISKTDSERSEVLSTGLFSVTVAALLLGLLGIMVLSEPLTAIILDDLTLLPLMQMAILTGMFNTIYQVPTVILRADRRVKTAATLNIINLLLNILITIILVVGFRLGVQGVVIANLMSSIISLCMALVLTFGLVRFIFSGAIWKKMLGYGLPFLPHRLQSIGLSQFGIFIVAEMLGKHDAGLYSIALRISMPMTFIVGAIQQAWVPYKFQIHAEDEAPAEFFKSAVSYYIAITAYLWVGISVWGPEVVRLLTTPEFFDAAYLIPFVTLVPFSMGLYFMFGTGMELSDNTRPMPLVSFGGLVGVVGTSFLLIPIIGAFGAALATTTGWLVMTVIIYYFSQKRFAVTYEWRTILALLAVATLMIALSFPLVNMSLYWRIGYSLFVSLLFPVLALLILIQMSSEHDRILHMLASIRDRLTRRLKREA